MTSYHIETAKGIVVCTFDTASAAREYCLKMKALVPGLAVVEVTTTITRRRIYTPRIQGRAA